MKKILVWDLPTRLGHWLLVTTFVLSFVTGDSETWRLVHVTAGYAMAGVLLFRIFWGIAGTRYARFASFLFSPRQVLAYLSGLLQGKASHWVGHNPAGSYAIYALMLLGVATTVSGWAVYEKIGGDNMDQIHELISYAMLGIVAVHVTGVVVSSRLHRENLVRSMIDGYKQGKTAEAIESVKSPWVILLLGSALAAGMMVYIK